MLLKLAPLPLKLGAANTPVAVLIVKVELLPNAPALLNCISVLLPAGLTDTPVKLLPFPIKKLAVTLAADVMLATLLMLLPDKSKLSPAGNSCIVELVVFNIHGKRFAIVYP
jgi:hypothetical protein